MKTRKILITGGTGALGRVLIPKLQKMNHQCLSISRIDKRSTDFPSKKCDLLDFPSLKQIIKKYRPDVIVHLAGLTGNMECENNPVKAFEHNVLGTYNILQASYVYKPKIIFASTREVYGNSQRIANEESALGPINYNGITKMMSENLIKDFHARCKMPYVILRFSNFYGENFEERGISVMLKKAIKGNKITIFGGKQELDLLHFEDASNAVIRALIHNRSDTFNIGTGMTTTPLQIIKLLERKLKFKIKYAILPHRKFEAEYCRINIYNAKIKMNFQATISLDETLNRMVYKWAKR